MIVGDLDTLEESRLDCQTGLHRKPLQAELPSRCPSVGTRSPDHRTHCTHSMLSTGTWCSPLEERGAKITKISLFGLITTLEMNIHLTAVFLIRPIYTVLLQVTPAVQVNTLPAVTGELLGGAGAGHQGALWSHHWSSCDAWVDTGKQ